MGIQKYKVVSIKVFANFFNAYCVFSPAKINTILAFLVKLFVKKNEKKRIELDTLNKFAAKCIRSD